MFARSTKGRTLTDLLALKPSKEGHVSEVEESGLGNEDVMEIDSQGKVTSARDGYFDDDAPGEGGNGGGDDDDVDVSSIHDASGEEEGDSDDDNDDVNAYVPQKKGQVKSMKSI